MAKFAFEKDLEGNRTPRIQSFPVAATQTLLVGDVVYLSSGQVTKGGASFASCLGVMAEDSAAQDAGTLVDVQVASQGYVYRATADADATSVVLTNKTMDLNATTQTIDVADTSNGCIIILELADSTTDIRVMFTEFDLGCVN